MSERPASVDAGLSLFGRSAVCSRFVLMRNSPQQAAGLSLLEVIVALAIVVILVWMAIPQVSDGSPHRGQMTLTLNNARQIHIATLRMTTDADVEPNPKLGWPGDLPDVQTLPAFVERLVEYKY